MHRRHENRIGPVCSHRLCRRRCGRAARLQIFFLLLRLPQLLRHLIFRGQDRRRLCHEGFPNGRWNGDGRFFVVEYKGALLAGAGVDDTNEKRAIGRLWESRSGGMGMFLVVERAIDGRDMRAQMLDKIEAPNDPRHPPSRPRRK